MAELQNLTLKLRVALDLVMVTALLVGYYGDSPWMVLIRVAAAMVVLWDCASESWQWAATLKATRHYDPFDTEPEPA